MERINVLFVGTATDGPTEEIVRVDSLDRMLRLFGGYHYERTTITSGATGYTLGFTPWGDEITPLQEDGNSFLIPKYLFEFRASGNRLTWTPMGTGSTVVFRGMKQPTGTDLLKAIWATQTLDTTLHVLRLGGTHAEATSGQYQFTARYAGARYNGSTITITGNRVILRPAVGTGRNWTYTITSDQDLSQQLRDDVARGFQSVYLTGLAARDRITLPTGTFTLTGGTDGTLTGESLKTFVEEYELSGVDVLCPVGLSTQDVSGSGVLQSLVENEYPTLLVAQAPIAASGVMLSGSVNTSRYLCSVAFRTTYQQGSTRQFVDDAAPLVAGMIGGRIFNLTFAPLTEYPPTPRFDQIALRALAAAGHTVPTYSISKGWALWRVLTGDSRWAVSTFRAYQEVLYPVFDHLLPLLGKSSVRIAAVRQRIDQALQAVRGSRVLHWDLDLDGDIVYVDLAIQPYGEVQAIRTRLALGQSDAIDIT